MWARSHHTRACEHPWGPSAGYHTYTPKQNFKSDVVGVDLIFLSCALLIFYGEHT